MSSAANAPINDNVSGTTYAPSNTDNGRSSDADNASSGGYVASPDRARHYKELKSIPIYRLPPELIIEICDRIDMVNFPSFMVATYHLLRRNGVIPQYPTVLLQSMLLRVEEDTTSNSTSLMGLPSELLLAIGEDLSMQEKVTMVLATHRMRPEEIEIITHQR